MNTESNTGGSKPEFPRAQINVILFIGALLWFISPIFVVLAYSRCDKIRLGLVLAVAYLIVGLVSFFVLDFWPTIAATYIAVWIHINVLGSRDPTAVAPVSSASPKGLSLVLGAVVFLLALFLLLAVSYYFFGEPPPPS